MCTDFLRRFRRCQSGVIAVEFAFIFPVVILVIVGLSDFARASKMDRDLHRASASVAQIVKRTGNFDASDKAEIQKGLLAVLGPQAAESYRLRVEGVSADEDRQLSIDWAWQPSGQLPASNPSDFFGTVLSADRGGVIVRIEQDFKSLFETGGFGVFRLSASHAASSTTASRIVSQ